MNGPDRVLEVHALAGRGLRAYLALAARAFGPHSYQADERYVRWLYDDSPVGTAVDGIVVADGDRVVGCVHKFRLPWRLGHGEHPVATVHNLYVIPEHRRGVGATLLLHTMRGEAAVFIPGATGAVARMYETLRWREVDTAWHRLVSPSWIGAWHAIAGNGATYGPVSQGGMAMTSTPDAEVIDACIESLNAVPGMRPLWSRETFLWRFFHPFGPRHVLAWLDRRTFALFSCGLRRHVRLARLLDAAYDDPDRFSALMRWATTALARRGALVAWSYSSRAHLTREVTRLGWRALDDPPRSFLHLRTGGAATPAALNASAGDFGFESIRDRP